MLLVKEVSPAKTKQAKVKCNDEHVANPKRKKMHKKLRPQTLEKSRHLIVRHHNALPHLHLHNSVFQHSAKSLFDLWLFLLRWPHISQAFLDTSPPSRPLLLERTGQTQHRGLYPLLFSNACVGSLMSHRELTDMEDICETGPTVYSPYSRRLESLTIFR